MIVQLPNKIISTRIVVLFLLLFLFLYLLNNNLHSQINKKSDTIITKKVFPDVLVESNKIQTESSHKYLSYSRINRKIISSIGGNQLSDLLSYSSGIYIKNYGGLNGIKSISIRGTSSEQSAILIDGMKINSTQSGMFDLNTIPAFIIDNIEIVRSGASSIYGANAIGGAVNINSLNPYNSYINAKFIYGSFNEINTSVNLSYKHNNSSLLTGFEYLSADGNYPISFMLDGKDTTLFRSNSDYKSYSMFAFYLFNKESLYYNTKLIYKNSNSSVPGPVLQNYYENVNSKYNEESFITINNLTFSNKVNSIVSFSLLTKINEYNYIDPISLFNGIDTRFTERNIQTKLKFEDTVFTINTMFSIDNSFSDLRGNNLDSAMNGNVNRNNFSLALKLEKQLYKNDAILLSALSSLRYDIFSDVDNFLSPSINIFASSLDYPINLGISYSTNFRPPCFNELYYLNYGSQSLVPEISNSLNFVFNIQPLPFLNINFNLFSINTRNQIISEQISTTQWIAKNIAKVYSRGLEFEIHTRFFNDKLNLMLAYTLQKTTDESTNSQTKGKQIIYIPQETINIVSYTNFRKINFGINANYSSHRFAQADNSYESLLSKYLITNCYAIYSIYTKNTKLDIRFDCNNIFDIRYAIIKNYPMPGMAFKLGLSVNYL